MDTTDLGNLYTKVLNLELDYKKKIYEQIRSHGVDIVGTTTVISATTEIAKLSDDTAIRGTSFNTLLAGIDRIAKDSLDTKWVLKDKVYWAGQRQQMGTMPNNGKWDKDITDYDSNGWSIPEGYHDGTGKITITDSDLKAENIKSGVNILGITGSMVVDNEIGMPNVNDSLQLVEVSHAWTNNHKTYTLNNETYIFIAACGRTANVYIRPEGRFSIGYSYVDGDPESSSARVALTIIHGKGNVHCRVGHSSQSNTSALIAAYKTTDYTKSNVLSLTGRSCSVYTTMQHNSLSYSTNTFTNGGLVFATRSGNSALTTASPSNCIKKIETAYGSLYIVGPGTSSFTVSIPNDNGSSENRSLHVIQMY